MKKIAYLLIYSCISLLSCLPAQAQDNDFWFVAPDVTSAHDDEPMFFVFSNPNPLPVNINIDLYGGTSFTDVIPANGYLKVDFGGTDFKPKTWIENPVGDDQTLDWITHVATVGHYNQSGTVQNYGIHIYSTDEQKFLAYYMVNGQNHTQKDIFALKGKVALGTYFITPFQEGISASDHYVHANLWYTNPYGSDQIDIVATENDTYIEFKPTRDCNQAGNNQIYSADQTSNVTLQKGETFKLRKYTEIENGFPGHDGYENLGTLSGTIIESDKPIAVTIAEDCITYNWSGGNDLAGDQIVPVDAASTRFVVIRGEATVTAGDPDATRERIDFVATVPDTQITVYYNGGTPITSPTLGTGATWHAFIDQHSPYGDTAVFVQSKKAGFMLSTFGGQC